MAAATSHHPGGVRSASGLASWDPLPRSEAARAHQLGGGSGSPPGGLSPGGPDRLPQSIGRGFQEALGLLLASDSLSGDGCGLLPATSHWPEKVTRPVQEKGAQPRGEEPLSPLQVTGGT